MSEKANRSSLEEEFVNVYRKVWGSNEGLTTKHIKSMSISELKKSIRSLKGFVNLKGE